MAWLKPAVFTGCCAPLAFIIHGAATGTLGANPISTALNQFGLVAMIMLIASLACTPMRILAGRPWPLLLRKMLGLFGFFYASLHLLTYVALDQAFALSTILQDVTQRPFIIVGMTAFALLVPLALTSNQAAIKKMGKKWRLLHKLVYVISPLVIVHFTMRLKADISQPFAYGTIVAGLLTVRFLESRRKR